MNEAKFVPFGGTDVHTPNIEDARVVVLPICYENASSYGIGSRKGPIYFLDASAQLEQLDEETFENWAEYRIHTLKPLIPSNDPQTAVSQIKEAAETVLRLDKFLLSVGGDHAITIGLAEAAYNKYPDMGILQVDAHWDLRDIWNGSKYNHACVMRRIVDDMNLPAVQVGIRSFSPEELEYRKTKTAGLVTVFAHEIERGDRGWIKRAVQSLPEKVYLTIDLDGLDPSIIPGTGTPEPGGLMYRELVDLIKAIGAEKTIVAADINELSKIEGTQVSEFTAAKIATKILVHCLK